MVFQNTILYTIYVSFFLNLDQSSILVVPTLQGSSIGLRYIVTHFKRPDIDISGTPTDITFMRIHFPNIVVVILILHIILESIVNFFYFFVFFLYVFVFSLYVFVFSLYVFVFFSLFSFLYFSVYISSYSFFFHPPVDSSVP